MISRFATLFVWRATVHSIRLMMLNIIYKLGRRIPVDNWKSFEEYLCILNNNLIDIFDAFILEFFFTFFRNTKQP